MRMSGVFGRRHRTWVIVSSLSLWGCLEAPSDGEEAAEPGSVPSDGESDGGSARPAAESATLSFVDRQAEADKHLEDTYFSRLSIRATTVGPRGETVDWVDPRELDPLFDSRKPPSESEIPTLPPEGVVLADAELEASSASESVHVFDLLKEEWAAVAQEGPPGMVPVIRPDLGYYVSGKSGAKDLPAFLESLAKPQPAGQNRLYAAKRQVTTNIIGTTGWIQYVNPASVGAAEMSLSQLAVLDFGCGAAGQPACPVPPAVNTTLEAIEVGIQELPSLYNDSNIHFFTFFRTAGGATGDYVGGYNMTVAGFVPQPGAFPPGAVIPNPPAGSAHERRLRTVLSGGAWWVQDYLNATTFTWLGYYPIGTGSGQINFNLINTQAREVHWYGEIYDPTPTTPNWTSADLGNGIFGRNTGSLSFHGMIVERSAGGNIWFSGTNVGPTDTNCYDTSANFTSTTPGWEVSFRYGGPGGNAAGCD